MNHSIEALIEHGQQQLLSCSDSAKLDAQLLLCTVLNKERTYLLTWPEQQVSNKDTCAFFELLARRITGEPIAYITGVKEFWSLPFYVSPATLIPRPDTEILIELVLAHYGNKSQLHCLDLGTGTGAIALALASEFDDWSIDAVDFSEEAVCLAQRNSKNLMLEQVNIYQSDWFSHVKKQRKFDLIVSNPPYIDCDDENLTEGDVRFEPKSALVAQDTGLADIKHITGNAHYYLQDGGGLFFEHGYDQGQAVRDILSNAGYQGVQTEQDLNGHERITWGILTK